MLENNALVKIIGQTLRHDLGADDSLVENLQAQGKLGEVEMEAEEERTKEMSDTDLRGLVRQKLQKVIKEGWGEDDPAHLPLSEDETDSADPPGTFPIPGTFPESEGLDPPFNTLLRPRSKVGGPVFPGEDKITPRYRDIMLTFGVELDQLTKEHVKEAKVQYARERAEERRGQRTNAVDHE